MKKQTGKSRVAKPRSNRNKLDPRLAFLLSLPPARLKALKETEDRQQQELAAEIRSLIEATAEGPAAAAERAKGFADVQRRIFAPLSAGLHFPDSKSGWLRRAREPYLSAFVLFDGSADDLRRLGVGVRAQAGDVFTVFAPLSAIGRLEESAALRFVELARLNMTNLDEAVPFAQIDTLHAAAPAVTGAGVIVGILDSRLDIYHPDFRTAANATRVRFLWDQTLAPQGGEAGPPVDPVLPGFTPVGGATYGVEYAQGTIDNELTSFNPPGTPAYQTVRHGGTASEHGTHVAGIAVGNGLGNPASNFVGAAPGSDLIFVALAGAPNTALTADSAALADGFAYVFARAALLGMPCVANRSGSDNQGPHDGTTLGEQFLDNLLLTPGRAITLAAGNSNNTNAHASGNVAAGGTANLVLNYFSADLSNPPDGIAELPTSSDDVEIWYDGHDRFDLTLTIPTAPATVLGPVVPGTNQSVTLANNVQVQVTSVLNDARNGDNLISVIITVPANRSIPLGNWTFALAGTTVINGNFQAWVDRNNRGLSAWRAPFLQAGTLTLGVPSTARRPITVGNHDKTTPTPGIQGGSGRGPTRDGRIKPEIAATGTGVSAARSRNMNAANPGALYVGMSGTSMSAPLVAGACALLFECRGAGLSCADLKQIFENTAGTAGLGAIPNNAFGFGFLQMANACTTAAPNVDVWLRDHVSDTGAEPFAGGIAWLSPDIEVLDRNGNAVPNPTHDPVHRFNNIIRVTVRNRGTQPARNTDVFLYWADPATNLPFPAAWNSTGIFTGAAPNFPAQGNHAVIPLLAAGASVQVQFAWAPPAPGSNIRADDHFCLLARLEHESDPSQIAAGGWTVITAKNNIALRNVHVQPDVPGDSDMAFYVEGSADDDSLIVESELVRGRIELRIPVKALPWRDAKLIERYGRRPGYVLKDDIDLFRSITGTLRAREIEARTGIVGAESLTVRDGVAEILLGGRQRIWIPSVRLAQGARMPASVRVSAPKIDKLRRHVHITQLSGGRIIGGVSLEFHPRAEFPKRSSAANSSKRAKA
jgi:hypothetical protein